LTPWINTNNWAVSLMSQLSSKASEQYTNSENFFSSCSHTL
jgi:hypothetical protein